MCLSPGEPRGTAGRGAWLVLGLLALLGFLLAGLLEWTTRERAGDAVSSSAQETPHAVRPVVLDEAPATRQAVAEPDEDDASRPLEPSQAEATTVERPAPALVLVSGAAIRVDPRSEEHAGEDGALTLHVRFDGRNERRDVSVNGGQFALEVPPHATLHVRELVLGGRPVRVDPADLLVPEDRFLLLRGAELRGVLLHVLSAEDGRELEGVDAYCATGPLFQTGWQHPGTVPEEAPRVRGARSPFLVESSGDHAWASYSYWVRAPGHAWGTITLDHSAGGERSITLQTACALDVELVGLEDWLRPLVRLWPPDGDPSAGYPFAERQPDTQGRVAFEALPPGSYLVSAERGWAGDRACFGQAQVSIAAGERASVALPLELPARPREVVVSGRLVLNSGWEREGLELSFAAQGGASVWADGKVSVPLAAMSAASTTDSAGGVFTWSASLPVAGDYELSVVPLTIRRLLAVPPAGLTDVEVVVPGAAEVEVRVVVEESGEELEVERLFWSPPRVEGILTTPMLSVTRDPARGRITFRAPAGEIQLRAVDRSLEPVDEPALFVLVPGHNQVELRVHRQIGVRIRLRDGETILPWSWDWRLRAQSIDGEARDVSRSIDRLWFRETGVYELFADGGVPGYASIDGTAFEVRPLTPGEEALEVEIVLERERD